MRLNRKWWYAAGGITLYALAGFLLAPWLLQRALVGTLDERLELNTRLDSLAINPFTLTLTADGLAVTERDGSPVLAFERLFVNFELVSLVRWAVSFDEVHLIRPALHFERLNETETSVSRLADTWARTGAPPDPAPVPAPETPSEDLFRLVVADLSIVDGRLSVTDRARTEVFSTEFGPINLAVTDLSTLPDASGAQQVSIHTESGADLSWTGSLAVNPLSVTGTVSARGAHTPLLFRYFRDELELPIGIEGGEIDARLDYVVALDDGVLSARLDDLAATVSGVTVTQPDHPPLVELGAFSVSGGRFAWPQRTVHVEEIQLADVHIDAYRGADGSYLPLAGPTAAPAADNGTAPGTAQPPAPGDNDGTEPAAPAGDAAPDAWSLTAGRLRLTDWALSHTDTTLENGRVAISRLNLTLADLSNAPGQEMPLALDLTPAAGGRVAVSGRLTALPAVALAADVTVEAIPLAMGQPYLDTLVNVGIGDGSLSLAGAITSNAEEPLRYEGDFRIADLELTDRLQDERLLAWRLLAVDRLLARPASLELSSLTLDAPYARVEIEQGGRSNLDQLIVTGTDETGAEGSPAGPTPAPEAAEARAQPFVLSIGETRIDDGNARFEDLNLPLPFQADITGLKGSLSTLASNSNAPSRVAIEGQVNEYGRLKIAGNLQPFSPIRGTDITVAFNNVEMPRMSPYTIKFAGRRIADGRTDLTLTYQVVDGQLEGDNHLVIRDLRLGDKVPHPDAMNLPLDLAVALLKDPSGVVDFNFPVSGSLEDPQFSYSGAIMKAFANVILGLATAPFKLLGALVGVAPSEFEHISFEAGRADLTPPQREVLAKLADALAQRPQLTLSVTPVFDPLGDRRALQEAGLEARLDARLAGEEETDAMIGERRLKHLEALYDEAGLAPDRPTLKADASPPNAEGTPTFDPLIYAETLRRALIDAEPVADGDLTALAGQRVATVHQALLAAVELAPERLATQPPETEEADQDGQIRMPLEVTARGTGSSN